MTPFHPTHVATLGPEDYRKEMPVVWRYRAAIPSFHAVEDAKGRMLLVHVLKLKPMEEAETP